MGIETFGEYLQKLLADSEKNCSVDCLYKALNYEDPSTVYRWLRGEATPALRSNNFERIRAHLKLSRLEELLLRDAQIRSLTERTPRPPRIRKPPVSAPRTSAAPSESDANSDQAGRAHDEAHPHQMISKHARATKILAEMTERIEALPDAPLNSDADRTILVTWQGRDPLELSDRLQARWFAALKAALRRGWRIEYLFRLDSNAYRTVRLVEMMHNLVGLGDYSPRYFTTYGAMTPSYDLIILPGVAAASLFSSATPNTVDAGMITTDPEHILLFQGHAQQLLKQTRPLITGYFLAESDITAVEILRRAETQPGGRMLVKDGLSVITQPEKWFNESPPPVIPGALPTEDQEAVIQHRKERIAAFKRHIDHDTYCDICTERAIELLAYDGIYMEGSQRSSYRHAKQVRLEHLNNVVHLLRTYENYHLALVSEHQVNALKPDGISIKGMWEVTGDNSVFIAIQVPNKSGKSALAHLLITESTVAAGFREYFRSIWQKIPPNQREKEAVIQRIEREIRSIERNGVQAPD